MKFLYAGYKHEITGEDWFEFEGTFPNGETTSMQLTTYLLRSLCMFNAHEVIKPIMTAIPKGEFIKALLLEHDVAVEMRRLGLIK